MRLHGTLFFVLFALVLGGLAAGVAQSSTAPAVIPTTTPARINLSLVGSYRTNVFNEGAAEIVAHDPVSQRMYIVNGANGTIDIIGIANPATPVLSGTIPLSPTYGIAANSVAFHDGVLAAAVEAPVKTDPGKVVFFNRDGVFLNQVTIGALPDMLTFTPDGTKVLVANEAEPNADYTVDPEGSVSIVDLSNGVDGATVTTVGFDAFNAGGPRAAELPAGVRIFGPNASVAQDLEPEYIAISADSRTAYVTLQENNALAIIDIEGATVTAIKALGTKDLSIAGNGIDASDRDGPNGEGAINIAPRPVKGMYQPDAVATFEIGGQTYLVTANEGDTRVYPQEGDAEGEVFNEDVRIGSGDVTLDTAIFTDAATLQSNAQLGRLKITNTFGNTDADNDYEELYAFGGRSFSIWNGATGELIFDSGDDIEQRTAALLPEEFNSSNDENGSFDSRSDDKGPEPEGVVIGEVNGRVYAFVGLERIGGVMVYDVSTPTAPQFVQYINPRDFAGDAEAGTAGDLGPEGLTFVPAANSPNGKPLLLVANEVSGSTSIFVIDSREQFLPTMFRQ